MKDCHLSNIKKLKNKNKNTQLPTLVIVWMEDQFCKDIYQHLFQMTKDMGPE
jgi:hypothetical protein